MIANAVEVRRREFITARRCARDALAKLDTRLAAVLPPDATIRAFHGRFTTGNGLIVTPVTVEP